MIEGHYTPEEVTEFTLYGLTLAMGGREPQRGTEAFDKYLDFLDHYTECPDCKMIGIVNKQEIRHYLMKKSTIETITQA